MGYERTGSKGNGIFPVVAEGSLAVLSDSYVGKDHAGVYGDFREEKDGFLGFLVGAENGLYGVHCLRLQSSESVRGFAAAIVVAGEGIPGSEGWGDLAGAFEDGVVLSGKDMTCFLEASVFFVVATTGGDPTFGAVDIELTLTGVNKADVNVSFTCAVEMRAGAFAGLLELGFFHFFVLFTMAISEVLPTLTPW